MVKINGKKLFEDSTCLLKNDWEYLNKNNQLGITNNS
jgi:hypothetical protein